MPLKDEGHNITKKRKEYNCLSIGRLRSHQRHGASGSAAGFLTSTLGDLGGLGFRGLGV